MAIYFIKAILVGLTAAIPLGPLGIVCIQRTLNHGRWSGFAVGIGAAIGDTIYAAISLFSLSFVSEFLDRNRVWVLLIGGIIIMLIGIQIAMKNPIKDVRQPKKTLGSGLMQDVLRGFLMTLSNPGALVLMLGICAFFGLDMGGEYRFYLMLIILGGICLGSIAWWFLLSGGINLFRKRFRLRQLLVINRIAGTIIALIGLASLAESLAELIFHQPLI